MAGMPREQTVVSEVSMLDYRRAAVIGIALISPAQLPLVDVSHRAGYRYFVMGFEGPLPSSENWNS